MNIRQFLLLATAFWSAILLSPSAFGQSTLPIESIGCLQGDGKYREAYYENREQKARICQIGDKVEIEFKSGALANWLKENPKNGFGDLVLAVDGHVIAGSSARTRQLEKPDKLTFYLAPTWADSKNLSTWKAVLPGTKIWDSQTKLITVSDPKGRGLGSKEIGVRVADPTYIVGMALLALAVIGALMVLAWRSDILKEFAAVPHETRRPYSLALTQMAFWFTLVFTGFIYLAVVLGTVDVFSTSALGLIGISATTGLFATAIGGAKRTEEAAKRLRLLKERDNLQSDNAGLLAASNTPNAQPGDFRTTNAQFAANEDLIAKIDFDLRSTTKDRTVETKGGRLQFFWDLLCSDGNISLSRFQMIAWTLIFGFYYLFAVISTLQMPEFSTTALGLLGLSSGTYVGFKFPTKDGK